MEESLQAQIRELKDRQLSVGEAYYDSAELDALKLEMGRVREWQEQFAAERIRVDQLEAAIRGKLDPFSSGSRQISEPVSSGDFNDLKFELKMAADRMARAEFSIQQALEQLTRRVGALESSPGLLERIAEEQRRWGEMIEQRLNGRIGELADELCNKLRGGVEATVEAESHGLEMAALADRVARLEQSAVGGLEDFAAEIGAVKSRLNELAGFALGDESVGKKIEEAISTRIDPLQESLSMALGVFENHSTEIKELHEQLRTLAHEVSQLASHGDDRAAQESKRAQWAQEMEESISARMAELGNRLGEIVDVLEKSKFDRERFQREVNALLARVEATETSYQQTQLIRGSEVEQLAAAIRAELAALDAELRRHAVATSQGLLQAVEGTVHAKMDELQNVLAREQQSGQTREALLYQLREDVTLLAERVADVESSAQQTHALMVNEAAQSEQLRESVTRELATLHSQSVSSQSDGARIDSLAEQLNARIIEAQNQWSQKWALLARRDAEIAEIKMQVQNLIGTSAAKHAAQPEAPIRPSSPIGVTVGLSSSKSPPAESETATLLRSYESASDGSKDQKKQLQQRISADIERVRAELRKRAGMSR
jgi:post-segregation antitoxin (ccd killing protein)